MKIVPIFEGNTKLEDCDLWAVVYGKDTPIEDNIFSQLLERWTDTEYVREFIKEHHQELQNPIWNGISRKQALNKVMEEAEDFESELKNVEAKIPGYEKTSLDDIFEPLHNDEFRLRQKNKDQVKAKPHFDKPMLRIYGVKLSDGSYVVTGGGIKLTVTMKAAGLEGEVKKIEKLQEYLEVEGITTREGLIEAFTE